MGNAEDNGLRLDPAWVVFTGETETGPIKARSLLGEIQDLVDSQARYIGLLEAKVELLEGQVRNLVTLMSPPKDSAHE